MNQWQLVLGYIFIATVCIRQSGAISCYECNSASDKRCLHDQNHKLTEDLKKQCPERTSKDGKPLKPFTLCRKIKQVIDFEVNGLLPDSRIIRTCGYEDTQYQNRCYQRSGFGGRQEVCSCQNDDCNGKSVTVASSLLILGSILVKFYL